jgi:hypothetical protein
METSCEATSIICIMREKKAIKNLFENLNPIHDLRVLLLKGFGAPPFQLNGVTESRSQTVTLERFRRMANEFRALNPGPPMAPGDKKAEIKTTFILLMLAQMAIEMPRLELDPVVCAQMRDQTRQDFFGNHTEENSVLPELKDIKNRPSFYTWFPSRKRLQSTP